MGAPVALTSRGLMPMPGAEVFRSLIRAGAIALVLGALMTVPVVLSVHPPTDPARNLEWATQANSTSYRIGWTLQVYAVVPLLIGAVAVFVALAGTVAARTALIGLLVTLGSAGILLSGLAYPVIVMPAAGTLLGQGVDATVLRLLDQIFREPAWIPIFFGGLVYGVGWTITGLAIWMSKVLPRWIGALVVAMGVVEIPAFLDQAAFQLASPVVTAAAGLALGGALWRHAGGKSHTTAAPSQSVDSPIE